ncbi:TFIID-18kDa-domain-containing protein [Penicillium riverlandense]|uniref:TFIID-18kDa-domain-containing protein n=1 Tax=Penicillium riverlandense TaxID=1903569 RepID=UPI0025486DE1|nr:TFIID-18kDa-domain-containing protein [Penicillium riverlandense]KAJ5819533.1 TFIID-18kDa-domain-containing protein [Penicillium riverlandense]
MYVMVKKPVQKKQCSETLSASSSFEILPTESEVTDPGSSIEDTGSPTESDREIMKAVRRFMKDYFPGVEPDLADEKDLPYEADEESGDEGVLPWHEQLPTPKQVYYLSESPSVASAQGEPGPDDNAPTPGDFGQAAWAHEHAFAQEEEEEKEDDESSDDDEPTHKNGDRKDNDDDDDVVGPGLGANAAIPEANPQPDDPAADQAGSGRDGNLAGPMGGPPKPVKAVGFTLTPCFTNLLLGRDPGYGVDSECAASANSIADHESSDSDTDSQDSNDAQEGIHTDNKTDTENFFKDMLADLIQKMMFVSGETAEPSAETTTLIEEITRQQVIEILSRSTQLATRRGVRSISTDDLIFLIRHDKAKVSRLRTFLSWKDVRKNVKDSDDKGGGDAADFAAADDTIAGGVAGPQDMAAKPKNKRAKVGLAWDVNSFYSIQVPEREDEEDEEEEEQNYATLQRLAAADERTKYMTREEYVFWSECRQASFTYRKSKRFREWAGFGIVTESKPNDDIVDILGFLTFEIVQTLTEEALKVKEREDHEKNRGGGDSENSKKRKRETGLFDPPEEGRTPIEPRHVREAYRKLQATPQKQIAMLLHNGRVPARLPLRLI